MDELTSAERLMAANALRNKAGEVESVAGMGRYADTLRKVARVLEADFEAEDRATIDTEVLA